MKPTLGLIVGNRGFFPDELVKEGREEILQVLKAMNCEVIALGPGDTKLGAIETYDDSRKCANLFKGHADKIDGVIVTLPNFGDERGVADTLRLAGLNVPVLVHASSDDPQKAMMGRRRDSFCGKISVCNNLNQYRIPFSLTKNHTVKADSEEFRKEIRKFIGVCRVVKGMRNMRIGAIGARPAAFNTVRFSEKILESQGVSVDTIDLSEILGRIERLTDTDARVSAELGRIKDYAETSHIDEKYLVRMAKLAVVIHDFVRERDLKATAIQCWTAMEEYLGIAPCAVMSLLSDSLIPSACEVDVLGALTMYALQLASGQPSALLDWNNNYGDDQDKCVLFHCSNLPRSFFSSMRLDFHEILAETLTPENTYGTCVGRIKPEPMTFARLSTDDASGRLIGYLGQGAFTDDPLKTFGGFGVVEIPDLQNLLKFICQKGFEHHVAVNLSSTADVLYEAFTMYLGIEIYYHN